MSSLNTFTQYSKALLPAISSGKVDDVMYLLNHGADVNYVDPDKETYTPLTQAITKEDKVMINLLIDNGADVNLPDSIGIYPLEHSLKYVDLTSLLLSKSANPSYALLKAISSGKVDRVVYLLDNGADVNFLDRTKEYYTPLTRAITKEDEVMINLLLSRGADVNLPDNIGESPTYPLTYAVDYSLYLTRLLLSKGADPDVANALHEAIIVSRTDDDSMEIVLTLIEHGANVDVKNDDGDSPLIIACRRKRFAIIPILLEYDADVDIQNNDGHTALIELFFDIVTEPLMNIVSLLVQKSSNLDLVDNYGRTVLQLAISQDNVQAVELLLEHGADPWYDGNGESYLYYAMEEAGSESILESLLKRRRQDVEEGALPEDQEIVSDEELNRAYTEFQPLLLQYRLGNFFI